MKRNRFVGFFFVLGWAAILPVLACGCRPDPDEKGGDPPPCTAGPDGGGVDSSPPDVTSPVEPDGGDDVPNQPDEVGTDGADVEEDNEPPSFVGPVTGYPDPPVEGKDSDLWHLIYAMGEPPPDGPKNMELRLAKYQDNPNAVLELREAYDATPVLEGGQVRFFLTYIASRIPRPDALEFMVELAMSPPVYRVYEDGEIEDLMYPIRFNAVVGIANSVEHLPDWSSDAVHQVINYGPSDAAQQLGLELFALGLYDSELQGMLCGRGFLCKFRKLSEAERLELLKVGDDDAPDEEESPPLESDLPELPDSDKGEP
ncbi:MAG: hypothetical protein FWD57_15585 [Polyangiaceae bacterium]|nr:hypothetical protein [Polyangiaceae bacterium]